MKSLIITVAGLSSRFNKDTDDNILKCLYYEDTPAKSLLSMQVRKVYGLVDEVVVVGGYKYEDLVRFINLQITDADNKIKMVYNNHYSDYGSCYSLLKGIDALSDRTDEVIFIEGDLLFDAESAGKIVYSQKDVITVNNEPILSNKAVVLYFDANNRPHYIYDTGHSCLEIKEPFTAIYNSGQMWKFMNPDRIRQISRSLTPEQEQGTNLEIIQGYFSAYTASQIDIVKVGFWFNCNTIADYKEAVKRYAYENIK
jgi:choline kinase